MCIHKRKDILKKDKSENTSKLIGIRTDNFYINISMAEKCLVNDKLKAIEYYKKALKVRPDDMATYTNIAGIYHDLDMFEEALKYYNKIIDIDSFDSDIHVNIANIYQELELTEKAIKHYSTAIEINPDDADAYINMGFLHCDLNNDKEALLYFHKGLNLSPSDFNLIMNIADLYHKCHDTLSAIKHYRMALYIQTNNNDAKISLAYVLLEIKDFCEAEKLLIQALENAQTANAHMNLAHVYICQGKINLAKEHYKLSYDSISIKDDFHIDIEDDFYLIEDYISKKEISDLLANF